MLSLKVGGGNTWAITGTAGDVSLSLTGTPLRLGWSISGSADDDRVSLDADPSHDRWGARLYIGDAFTSIDGRRMSDGAWSILCIVPGADATSLTGLLTPSGAQTFADRDGTITLTATPVGRRWEVDGAGPLHAWLVATAFVIST